ncbi:MAG: S8 family serine peptidase [Deltaproteobacteria bacterium]|nr:S8 family serine peptidase [Deltaproteobacteria bacterium]
MVVALVLAASMVAAGTVSVEGERQRDEVAQFLDGGLLRVVERTGPGRGVFVDPATGRRAPVRFGDGVIVALPNDDAARARALADLSIRPTRELSRRLHLALVVSLLPDEDALALAARLAPAVARGVIGEAYPDLAFLHSLTSIDVPPNDPRYGDQWYLEDIDIEAAWAESTGSPDVTIQISDNGCDLTHPDLIDKLDSGYDFIDGDDDPSWSAGNSANHGTACAGLAAASSDNGVDIAGACPDCRLRCAKMIPGADDPSPLSADVDSFDYALEVDADVVSNSWGFVDPIPVPTPLKNAIIEVQQRGRGGLGAVVVFAAGNESHVIADDELLAVEGVLGVGAVSNVGELTQYTNGGDSVDLVAPTGAVAPDIHGADGSDPGDVTTTFSGTSSATPIVAGIAGLMIARNPELTADEINEALMATAKQSLMATPDDGGHDQYFGFGLVQPAAAISYYDDPEVPVPPQQPCGSCAHAPLDAAGLVAALTALGSVTARRRRRHGATALRP